MFADEVVKKFGFLSDAGLTADIPDRNTVCFGNARVVIAITCDRYSGEVDAYVADKRKGGVSYSLGQVVRLLVPSIEYVAPIIQGENALGMALTRIQQVLDRCIERGLLWRPDLFQKLGETSEMWAREYGLQTQLENAVSQANEAWRAKDYCGVLKLLSPLQEHLSEVSLRKLEFAKKQIKDCRGSG